MIEINGVNKKFSNTDALNNVIAAVQEKSIFGLVGPMEREKAPSFGSCAV